MTSTRVPRDFIQGVMYMFDVDPEARNRHEMRGERSHHLPEAKPLLWHLHVYHERLGLGSAYEYRGTMWHVLFGDYRTWINRESLVIIG